MVKAKPSPKKDASQQKILSFFTKNTSASSSSSNSNLFSHVGRGAGRSKLATKKTKSTKPTDPIIITEDSPVTKQPKNRKLTETDAIDIIEDSPLKNIPAQNRSDARFKTLEAVKKTSKGDCKNRAFGTGKFGNKSELSFASNIVAKVNEEDDDFDSEIIPDTPRVEKHADMSLPVTPLSAADTSDMLPDTPLSAADTSDILPDTPDAENSISLQKRKTLQKRSFLSSSNVLQTGGGPVTHSAGRVIKCAKRLSSSEKLKKSVSMTVGGSANATWNSSDVGLNTVMADMGLPTLAKTTGVKAVNSTDQTAVKETNRSVLSNSAIRGKLIAQASLNLRQVTGGKRSASSATGESPDFKKTASGSGVNAGFKSRLNLDQTSTDNTVKAKDEKESESAYFVPETQYPEDEEEEKKGGEDKERKSFHWGSKKKERNPFAKNKVVSAKDDVLKDILNEMKQEEDIEQKVSIGKKKNKLNNSNLPKSESRLTEENMETMENEADDALMDIMGELKDSLYKQNQLSAQGKKVGRSNLPTSASKKPYCRKLNLGTINDSGLSEPTAEGKKPAQTGIFSAESSQDSLDPVVAENKAGALLMEDDSWLEEMDMDGENGLSKEFSLLSPYKQRKGQEIGDESCPGYRPDETLPPYHAFGRHKVLEIQHNGASETCLQVERVADHVTTQIVLKGFWCDTPIHPGDILHVITEGTDSSSGSDSGVLTVDDNAGLLVLQPDLLISGTSVVGSVHCLRKAVLNEKFKGIDRGNIYMLHGSLLHTFFQAVLSERAYSAAAMTGVAQATLHKHLHDMYGQEQTEQGVGEVIDAAKPMMEKFVQRHMDGGGKKGGGTADIVIMDIADIEENVWSPRFGIKGKIDLTVRVKIHEKQHKRTVEKVMPLELKTGRATYSIEHKGQVTLYSMMSSDRRTDPQAGLLLYLKEADMKTIPANHINKRGLIQLRNELAFYLSSSMNKKTSEPSSNSKESADWPFGSLPPPINNPRSCGKCPQLLNCAAYQRSIEKSDFPPSHAMSSLVPEALQHLSESHLAFYTYWLHLLHLEASTCHAKKVGISELWCKTAWERECSGECLSGMLLVSQQCRQHEENKDKYIQVFVRHPRHISKFSVDSVGINKGDSLVVSAENQPRIALSMGYVHQLTDDKATLLLDRDLSQYPDHKDLIFRLDKADTYNTMAVNFTNISRLMDNTATCEKLRELIVDRRAPQFDLTLSKTSVQKVRHMFKSLNKPQKTAILKSAYGMDDCGDLMTYANGTREFSGGRCRYNGCQALLSRDYVQIKGYPGTGKTSTIVALVRILVCLGQSVLLTSYTHSAVDNILLKLVKHNVDFVRLGRQERIHEDIRPYSAELLTKNIQTVPELAEFYSSKSVVACTCLGTNHPVFSRRTFDVCIVDEASQVLQPACLGPLFVSAKFVLVGDPLQLPPVVQSAEARERGMSDSLFARLDDTGGTYELNLQYRMNSEIQRLSNELVYDGALKCGADTIANATLSIDTANTLWKSFPGWIQTVLTGSEVMFLNTDTVTKDTAVKDSSVKNVLEGCIVLKLVSALVKAKVPADDIGIISPYREQVTYLRDLVHKADLTQFSAVEVNTVDQYQGRDKSVIIVSFVKGDTGPSSSILRDVRRLNVALTRAKHKLLLLGSKAALMQYSPLQRCMQILHPHQIMLLPPDAAENSIKST